MSASLKLVRIRLGVDELGSLWRWAAARGYLPNEADSGYALHAALNAAFGESAPQPFYLRPVPDGAEILGYSNQDEGSIRMGLDLPGAQDHQICRAFSASNVDVREMPTMWRAGTCLDFEVRVRPVVRTSKQPRDATHDKRSFERDAFLWALEKDVGEQEKLSREEVYADWLNARFRALNVARPLNINIHRLSRATLLVRPKGTEGRRAVLVDGPDVTFRGTLEVSSPDRFVDLLRKGIGRHKAFGFGCLLLAPRGSL